MSLSSSSPPLVVFSHLRWNFVYQRPQHLMSRLSHDRQVIFIEEPIYDDSAPHWETSSVSDNIVVCRPHLSIGGPGFNDDQLPLLIPMLKDLFEQEEISDYALWLYTPMALPLARSLPRKPLVVAYDCMDELSAFNFAPPQLVQREQELMEWADVMFTGGPSLYEAKKGKHSNLHCFPSSVDITHFSQAKWVLEAPDQEHIPRPRLGWFGVIDERMDLAILEKLAKSHPEWQIVMIGPVVKIDPDSLPKYPNIYYLGPRDYDDLPDYLAGWQVCIQPFAINESTRYISPTKTLEYMAADLPIVSTRVKDVAEPYGEIVYLANSPKEFVQACEQALTESPEQKEKRIKLGAKVLQSTSWDTTAHAIDTLIRQAMPTRLPVGA